MSNEKEKLLTIEQACDELNLTRGTLYQYVFRDIIGSRKIKGKLYFEPEEIEKYKGEQKVKKGVSPTNFLPVDGRVVKESSKLLFNIWSQLNILCQQIGNLTERLEKLKEENDG